MTTSPTSTRLASHVSIDTQDMARSRAFYRALLGAEPVLVKPDYVRFWPAEFALVIGLNARSTQARSTGALQHLGLLFADSEALLAARTRLAEAGYASTGAEHVECCYAELDQFWATDPSGVLWELFLAHEDGVEAAARTTQAGGCCTPDCCS